MRKLVLIALCLGPWCVPRVFAQYPPNNCDYFVDNSSTGCSGSGCSDGNAGTTLAAAFLTMNHACATSLTAGQTICGVGKANPNTTNGGIFRADQCSVTGTGTGWGPGKQISITSMDPSMPIKLTAARCYGAASGLCTGSTPITWHKCTTLDALCNNVDAGTTPNILNVYEYTRPNAVVGAIYVDDPDPFGATLWGVPSKMLYAASGLPGAGSTRANNKFQGDMTAGTWWDDGTHLYIWMSGNANPTAHIIEAPSIATASSSLLINGTTHDYVYVSNIDVVYYPTAGFWWSSNAASPTNHLWFDNVRCGAQGAGPVSNETGYYAACGLFQASNSAQPGGAVSAAEIHVTNSRAEWCGSHNCWTADGIGPGGFRYFIGDTAGTAEHEQFDAKCAGTNFYTNNHVHDAWTGSLIGADSTSAQLQAGLYSETDWSACTGGFFTFTGNTGVNENIGIYCNESNVGGAAITKTCNEYNNTMVLNSGLTVTNAAYFFSNSTNSTLTGDIENNVAVLNTSTGEGLAWSLLPSGATASVTERNNLFFNAGGTVNQDRWANTEYTTLASWVAACGGGTGCGTADLWQKNPFGLPDPTVAIAGTSPAVGSANTLVGTGSANIGAAPVAASIGGQPQQVGAGTN